MEIRPTAQLIISNHDAILAYSVRSDTRGPDGETHFAALLSTRDAGSTWTRIPLHRTFFDRLRHWGYPTWPPEAVIDLAQGNSGTQMIFRDEWVPYAKMGGESLWQAKRNREGKWSTSRIRYMDYEGIDSPQPVSEITLSLPPPMKSPDGSVLENLV